MDDIINEFVQETFDSLITIDGDLIALEANPDDLKLLGNVFRLMHTIKGTCGFLGLSRLEKLAHSAENLLESFRSQKLTVSEEAVTLLLICVDRVRYLVSEVQKNKSEPSGADVDLITQIENILNKSGETAPVMEANLGVDLDIDNIVSNEDVRASDTLQNTQIILPVTEFAQKDNGALSSEIPVKKEKSSDTLKVQIAVLEDLINMVSELVLTRNQLLQKVKVGDLEQISESCQRLNRVVSELQDTAIKTRMQPIGNAWVSLPRIVRDLTTDLKKKISFEMSGEDTELDRQVLEIIKDPLTHMIRNSCDHGIETPAQRRALGKSETGKIQIKAFHDGGFIVIQIIDDGKGLDAKVILEKALDKKIVDQEVAKNLSDKQIYQFIMAAGFSTAQEVTNVSGRGVGMDVVQTNIEKIGGTIEMDSVLGQGSTFTIKIPLTLAIIAALIVEIDGGRYALPQLNIQELVRSRKNGSVLIEFINNMPVFRLRERIIPLLNSKILFKSDRDEQIAELGKDQCIVVIHSGAVTYGIIVDRICTSEEIVIKPITSALKKIQIFSGNTILGDGEVIMIIDPAGVARRHNIHDFVLPDQDAYSLHNYNGIVESASMLVFAAGDGIPKTIPLALTARLQCFKRQNIRLSGDKMLVEYEGSLLPLMFIDQESQSLASHKVYAIILSDDRSDSMVGIIIDEIIDIYDDGLNLNPATARAGILGSMNLGSHTVDMLDVTYFMNVHNSNWFSSETHKFKSFGVVGDDEALIMNAPRNSDGPTSVVAQHHFSKEAHILVVDDSSFFRNLLAPILRAAGFKVTVAESALQAIEYHDDGANFDLILSDIEMPVMDGYKFVEKMKESSRWKDLPFVAITSHNTPQDRERGMCAGFDGYIGKLDKNELISIIHHQLGVYSSGGLIS
jgi:two-component system chemotaxis sensor kinase CheA